MAKIVENVLILDSDEDADWMLHAEPKIHSEEVRICQELIQSLLGTGSDETLSSEEL